MYFQSPTLGEARYFDASCPTMYSAYKADNTAMREHARSGDWQRVANQRPPDTARS